MKEIRIEDAEARRRALDPAKSFIVQAPAGSGKTELLIQRFLGLLAVVERPEEVLAITFTRKAAGEMKRRVLQALARARRLIGDERAAPGASANEQVTLALARSALDRDAECGWRIEENTARLRIQTIDGLCASLTRQMPVLSRFGAQPRIVEDARPLHREAARRTLGLLEDGGAADRLPPIAGNVSRLLQHLDNNGALAEDLLAVMLARRDQWLRNAGHAPDREALEAALVAERAAILRQVAGLVSSGLRPELVALARYAASGLAQAGVGSPIRDCEGLEAMPQANEAGAPAWSGLVALLLTQEGDWRKTVNKNSGFPAGTTKAEKEVAKAHKTRHAALCAGLAAVPGMLEAFVAAQGMPPATYTEQQWRALEAIVSLLPIAAAQLKLVFAERGEVDFTEVAQGAVRALGEPDAPTDLLLSLDLRLRHILVDEFQDTSISQFELIERLTAGWQGQGGAPTGAGENEGEGRSLFLVGDPMQSIYRFREAEVGLFLRARSQGIGALRLEPLTLSTNFRSQGGIVGWVNDAFARIFPDADDAMAGSVGFAHSVPFHATLEGAAVSWHAFLHDGTPGGRAAARLEEARRVADIVNAAKRAQSDATVAILVRSRTHLADIVPALKLAGLRFRAIDIEQLHEKQVVQDLLALTRALAHPGDRIAWLACLRAPWCGLTLADLLRLSADEGGGEDAGPALQPAAVIWDALNDDARLARVSEDGRRRLARVQPVFARALAARMRGALRDRVEGAWLALGGPASVDGPTDLEDAEMYLDALDGLDEGGELADPSALEARLEQLYALPDLEADGTLQVMTIHKAKGLEFDSVILPGLDRGSRANDPPLLQWRLRPGAGPASQPRAGERDGFRLLLAPIKEAGEVSEPIGEFLARLGAAEDDAESARLLYVAATRAASRLHLLAAALGRQENGQPVVQAPSRRSLLAKCWPFAEAAFARSAIAVGGAVVQAEGMPSPVPLADSNRSIRLSADWSLPELPSPAAWPRVQATRAGDGVEFAWVGETLRHVGTVTHRWLQRMAEDELASWDGERIDALQQVFRNELSSRGVAEAELDSAAGRVRNALANVLEDERGRWLLGPQAAAQNEHRITARVPGTAHADGSARQITVSVVIDRLFRDEEGRQWIVDYKTSSHEGADVEAFLDRERERYRGQLARYAMVLATSHAALALYFPLLRGWREWRADDV